MGQREARGHRAAPNNRFPSPTTTGNVQTLNVSTRSSRSSVWIRSELPMTSTYSPSSAFSRATASATSPSSNVEFDHLSVSPLREATYWGRY